MHVTGRLMPGHRPMRVPPRPARWCAPSLGRPRRRGEVRASGRRAESERDALIIRYELGARGPRPAGSELVPKDDHRLALVVLVAEDADARRIELEQAPLGGCEAEPARRQHSKDMAARKDDCPVVLGTQAGE
jgi:hypothetical protein